MCYYFYMKIRVNKKFIVQRLDDKTVVFDSHKSVLYTLNETASYIFNKVRTGKEGGEIIDLMTRRYKIKKERAKKDFNELKTDLQIFFK